MKKRIGFVGLSTPIFYDYATNAERTDSDTTSSPNPVLDAGLGLIILYDELWFLCRSLCPQNLRDLHFVKFLDEEDRLPALDSIIVPDVQGEIHSNPTLAKKYSIFSSSMPDYRQTVRKVGIKWEAMADNHTHNLRVGTVTKVGNSTIENMLFDMEVIRSFPTDGVELISNSFTQGWIDSPSNPLFQASLTETLVIENIPNYLDRLGPYHPCLDEARENEFLSAFRNWVVEQSATATPNEIAEIKEAAELAILKLKNELLVKYLKSSSHYTNVAKLAGGIAIDLLVPGSSAVAQAAEYLRHFFDAQSVRWQGFLVSTEEFKNRS